MSLALSEGKLRAICRRVAVGAIASWPVTGVMLLLSAGVGMLSGSASWLGAGRGVPAYVLVLTLWPAAATVVGGIVAAAAGGGAQSRPALTWGILCAASGVLLLIVLGVVLAVMAAR